jgi:hypothetical protein
LILFSRRENMAVCGICGKILNREGKFEDVASLLWLCTLARWGKKFYGTQCHRNFMAATWTACHVERKLFLSWLT